MGDETFLEQIASCGDAGWDFHLNIRSTNMMDLGSSKENLLGAYPRCNPDHILLRVNSGIRSTWILKHHSYRLQTSQ